MYMVSCRLLRQANAGMGEVGLTVVIVKHEVRETLFGLNGLNCLEVLLSDVWKRRCVNRR